VIYLSSLRGECDLVDILNMVLNVTYLLILPKDTKCNIAHAQRPQSIAHHEKINHI